MEHNGDVVRVAKLFRWEMGHRLPSHPGLCSNIHGHSYKLWVEVEGFRDDNGMVIDYADLTSAVLPIIEPLDHAFLCEENDVPVRSFLESRGFKHFLFPCSATAENIVLFLLDRVWDALAGDPRLRSITLRLQETEDTFASANRSKPIPS
ncbi:MAG: 6-carboxytetrahydropterin synthase [Bacteroidota bacterium]|nr:6-carboxytetrahydropterin synthase [Bacteroidota bacterium]